MDGLCAFPAHIDTQHGKNTHAEDKKADEAVYQKPRSILFAKLLSICGYPSLHVL